MIKIMTGVASTCVSIASLNRLARCSGSTRSVNVPFAPSGIWRIQLSPTCPALHLCYFSRVGHRKIQAWYEDVIGDLMFESAAAGVQVMAEAYPRETWKRQISNIDFTVKIPAHVTSTAVCR